MKILDREMLDRLASRAASSPRGRANENVHEDLEDPIQRFANALEPGTYVRPHRHADPPRWELFLALRGGAAVLVFNEEGCVLERVEISAEADTWGVEVPGGKWHTLAALEPGTVLFELKPGPYRPASDKEFAPWAPAEGEPACGAYEGWFRAAQPGDGPEDAQCPRDAESAPCP
ncbi:MAG: WbuC family cupin fold metalloprotein [Deltaproteobacteria bacterium]|nr:WbuC family cupin fold metalloprotein [Deltaproteobacteria bacterium]